MAGKFSKIYKILVCGGCSSSRERDIHSSCELLTLNVDIDNKGRNLLLSSSPLAALNKSRRGASLHRLTSDKFVIIGGCSGPEKHLTSMEIYDSIKDKWTLLPHILHQGRSCFVSHRSHNCILCYGGWNGRECIASAECIKVDSLIDENPSESMHEQIDKNIVFTSNSNFPLKNSCFLALDATITKNDKQQTMEISNLFVVGGWDGKRTLDSIFSAEIHTSCGSRSSKTSAVAIEKPNDDKTTFIETISSNFTHFKNLSYPVECHTCNTLPNDGNGRVFVVTGGFDGQNIIDTILIGHLQENGNFAYNLCRLSLPRECHCAEILDDKFLIIIGGWNGYEALKSVEIFEILSTDNEEDNVPIKLKSVEFFDDILLEGRNRPCSAVVL